MHARLILRVVLASFACASLNWGAIIINFDENGVGTVTSPALGTVPLRSFGKGVDPVDPANGLLPLIYDVAGTPGVGIVPFFGDILLHEPAAPTGVVSDLLRFTDQGLLVVYSDLEAGEPNPPLADVGIPVLRQANVLNLEETGPENGVNGLFNYAPIFPQPGAIATDQAIYNFTSDVPEPATFALFGLLVPILARRQH